jgi:hypothetical protein
MKPQRRTHDSIAQTSPGLARGLLLAFKKGVRRLEQLRGLLLCGNGLELIGLRLFDQVDEQPNRLAVKVREVYIAKPSLTGPMVQPI